MKVYHPIRHGNNAVYGFYMANFAVLYALDYGVEDPNAFLCLALGMIVFAFFLRRALAQALGF